jgi:hypothetical protein
MESLVPSIFHDFDLNGFWKDSEYAREHYIETKPTAALVVSIEQELGFRLPASYLELMHVQNGGIPRNTCFPTRSRTSWAPDHVAITGIMGIGRTKTCSLGGELGSKFMQEEWGYPEFGICVCDCPSAGHDMIMFDYRKCGNEGEPEVIHVDQERDFKTTFLAKNFETFVRGLVNESVYDTSAEDLKKNLAAIENGAFSTLLTSLISAGHEPDFGPIIRNVCRSIAIEKGYFALHDDEKSYLLYDIQFHLYTAKHPLHTTKEYLEAYPGIIALGDGELTTGGYAPGFIEDWLSKRRGQGDIIDTPNGGLKFSESFFKVLTAKIRAFQRGQSS